MTNYFAYLNYNGKIEIDAVRLVTASWNKYVEEEGCGCAVFPNNKEFFETTFENSFDAAYAASAGDYRWEDEFVYINNDGRLMSFSRLDDETCPVDMDKIDISSLIQGLQDVMENKKGYVVNNIPRAIHDALEKI